jgi:NADH:ubiquinone oxidoreductase subunit F (NADH-binding)/NADH:ubiquinone oxidoreductase subunit E
MPERPFLIPRLMEIQDQHGCLPDKELRLLAKETGTPLHRLQEVASFFPHFRQEWDPHPYVEVKVCRDMSCHLAGSDDWIHSTENGLAGLNDKDKRVVITGVSCLGRCDRAPACVISRHNQAKHHPGEHGDDVFNFHDRIYAGLSLDQMRTTVQSVVAGHVPAPEATPDLDYAAGKYRYWDIDIYRRNEKLQPYEATRRFLERWPQGLRWLRPDPEKEQVPAEERDNWTKKETERQLSAHEWLGQLNAANLRGMGGVGIPAHRKWLDLWQAEGDVKYVVCNGDESEPGTFKDRELLVKMPHLVVEGVLLAILMTQATEGYIFIRHEYLEQIAIVGKEIERAQTVLASTFDKAERPFPYMAVYTSPGGYICGEESALIEAMEDKRGQPRNKPPELLTNGLYDKPTVVNNVETLAWVPFIMLNDKRGEGYAKLDKDNGTPKRLFSISGDLAIGPDTKKPGAFEMSTAATLRELIEKAGGIRPGRKLQAVAPSGPSGGFLPAQVPIVATIPWSALKRYWDGFQGSRTPKPAEGQPPKNSAQQMVFAKFLSAALFSGALTADELAALFSAKDFAAAVSAITAKPAKSFDVGLMPLDLEIFRVLSDITGKRNVSFMLGAGLVVYDDTRDIAVEARNSTQFYRNESCGKCVPCRIGSQKLVEVGTQLLRDRHMTIADVDGQGPQVAPEFMNGLQQNVVELSQLLALTSICGLGRIAANPLVTGLTFFPQYFQVRNGRTT